MTVKEEKPPPRTARSLLHDGGSLGTIRPGTRVFQEYVLLEQGVWDASRFPAVTVGEQVLVDDRPVAVPETGSVDLTGTKLHANRQDFDYSNTISYPWRRPR